MDSEFRKHVERVLPKGWKIKSDPPRERDGESQPSEGFSQNAQDGRSDSGITGILDFRGNRLIPPWGGTTVYLIFTPDNPSPYLEPDLATACRLAIKHKGASITPFRFDTVNIQGSKTLYVLRWTIQEIQTAIRHIWWMITRS